MRVHACSCTFCCKHGANLTSHGDAHPLAEVRNAAQVMRCRFGTNTADFCVCAGSGVVPVALSETDGCWRAVVNVNTFSVTTDVRFEHGTTNFDDEEVNDRLREAAAIGSRV